MSSSIAHKEAPAKSEPTVREIGNQLMTRYVLPLEVMGLLLTAATIGAIIIAMRDPVTDLSGHAPTVPHKDGHDEPSKLETAGVD
jgi:hypothetical protein